MMGPMKPEKHWEKPSIELPPGWHSAMQELANLTGDVPLKYVYAVAIDRFLSDSDLESIEDAVWAMQRRSRKDLGQVAARHTAEDVQNRHKDREREERGPSQRAPRRKKTKR